jgi:hypothetical protein
MPSASFAYLNNSIYHRRYNILGKISDRKLQKQSLNQAIIQYNKVTYVFIPEGLSHKLNKQFSSIGNVRGYWIRKLM